MSKSGKFKTMVVIRIWNFNSRNNKVETVMHIFPNFCPPYVKINEFQSIFRSATAAQQIQHCVGVGYRLSRNSFQDISSANKIRNKVSPRGVSTFNIVPLKNLLFCLKFLYGITVQRFMNFFFTFFGLQLKIKANRRNPRLCQLD